MKRIPLAALFTLLSLILYAQNKSIDSLKKAIDTYSRSDTVKIMMLLRYGHTIRGSDAAGALIYFKQGLRLASQLKENNYMALANVGIANAYVLQNKYDSSIEASFEGLQICETFHLSKFNLIFLALLCDNYRLLGNYNQAEHYGQKLLDSTYARNDTSLLLNALVRVALLYNGRNREKEKEVVEKALSIAIQRKDESSIAKLYVIEANTLEETGSFNEAKRIFLSSLSLWQKLNYPNEIAYTQSRLSILFMKLNRKDSAAYYVYAALATAKSNNLKKETRDTYLALFRFDTTYHNYKRAIEDKIILDSLQDEFDDVSAGQTVSHAEIKYQQEKKDLLASIEKAQKDAAAKRIKNRQYLIITALSTIALAVLIIAVIQTRNNKHKQKANLLLQRQKEKVEATLSELKSTQALLIQSEKMASLGELTAGIAHEIQNPLNFVNNFSEVNGELISELVDEVDKGNKEEAKAIATDLKQNLDKISHHGKRADAIVKGMLEHSRQGTGQKQLTDINALAEEYLKLAYHGLRAKDKSFNVTMKTSFDNNIGKINIVAQDIGRVLLNLYNNAFYAVKEKQAISRKLQAVSYEPIVTVTTRKDGNRIIITVADNGNGIPPGIVDKIFQPFFTTKPTGQGTGLGLSLAYDIVNSHGGKIKVANRDDGGADFVIELPAS